MRSDHYNGHSPRTPVALPPDDVTWWVADVTVRLEVQGIASENQAEHELPSFFHHPVAF